MGASKRTEEVGMRVLRTIVKIAVEEGPDGVGYLAQK
jgi:hypothetical protein